MEGSSHLISCEAEGFPHPLVVLSRVTENGRREVNRGVKTASYNLTFIHRENEVGSYVCEASNEEARLEKEFKILIHGQSLFCW